MNKQDLTNQVSERAGLTKADASKGIDAIFEALTESLSQGESSALLGFGSFKISERAARDGRNPRTGERISIPASKTVKFVPGQTLKDIIKQDA